MNFRTATLLIIGMFGSFSVIIVTMMVLFWPGSTDPPRRGKATVAPRKVSRAARTAKKVIRSAEEPPEPEPDAEVFAETESSPSAQPAPVQETVPAVQRSKSEPDDAPPSGRRATRGIRIEQDEIRLLRAEMEKRLRQQLELHERKLSQLARQCESLEPGAAAQVILNLDDDTAREILKRMDRSAALNIAALLVRLGRATALPTHHEGK